MSPQPDIERLRAIKTLPSLLAYLRKDLDWPIETEDVEDLTFDYQPDELGIDAEAAVKIKEIKQLRPLTGQQPWGIFWINFEKKRLPVVIMRRVLRALVVKKRVSGNPAERKAWQPNDLLFISAYGEETDRAITLAHFVEDESHGHLAELRVLGWDDDDTPLKYDYIVHTLADKLRWRDQFESDPDLWRQTWRSAFTLRHREVITTSTELALALAGLAKRIRGRVRSILRHEDGFGQIRKLQRAFQQGLIHDLNDADFADMLAQTVTYGLFSVAVRRTFPGEGTAVVRDDVPNLIVTSPFLKDMLGIFLGIKTRKGKLDFDELGLSDVTDLLQSPDTHMDAVLRDFGNKTRGEDPVIHFYELFLNEYDKQRKVQRGVFYTPQPVVSYIVRSVHELLQTEFGLADGLASTTTWGEMLKEHPGLKLPPLTDEPGEKRTISPDEPFVQILDPATGTATFLVEVIDVIHRTLAAKWKQQRLTDAQQRAAWNDYVPQHLLPRLHAFELMMAPYAIAHMKIGLKLAETGYRFGAEERARIYLTNALEPWVKQLPLIGFEALAHEAAAVNEIKRHKRFTVVIGNPPYSHLSSNLTSEAMAIVEPYKFIDGERIQERGALSLQKNLQDDYVKFVRIAERSIEACQVGVMGLITNNSYMDSRSFRGMRYHLSETFHKGWMLDLHGSGKKDESVGAGHARDENVFDIMQGVAIALWVRNPSLGDSLQMHRADVLGPRNEKYRVLSDYTVTTSSWQSMQLAPPFFLFACQDLHLLQEYQQFLSVRDIFPIYSSGVKTHRDDFAYSFTEQEASEKLLVFCDLKNSDQELRDRFGLKDTNVWSLHAQRRGVKCDALQHAIRRCQYRPFDIRATCYSDDIIELARKAVMDQLLQGKNVALLCSQQQAEEGFRHVFCTRLIADWGSVSNRTRESTSAFPIWLNQPVRKSLGQGDFDFASGPVANVKSSWIAAYGTPENVFHFVYSVLHAPTYRARYAAFLRSDFPRLPLTSNLDLFRSLAKLGGELVALHLMESPKLDMHITKWIGAKAPEVEKVTYSDETVWTDKAQKEGFRGVPEPVWNFHIGGYQVCEKWLKDRKSRTLSRDDIEHYQKIVVALNETIRIMVEIDKIIEAHGGWPGAFQAEKT